MPAPSWAALPWVELLGGALAAALLLQALLCGLFAALLRRRCRSPELPLAHWPKAEVLLCLRGVDPALPEALAALAAQRYGGPWRLLLVVDSHTDPAWAVAEAALAQLEARGQASWQQARLIPLGPAPRLGSRKCGALRCGLRRLHPATELVALVDADAVVRPDWLSQLAQGCGQPGVGAAGGNRWYLPAQRSGAGMVRAIWNGGALVLMTLLSIPWGGSLAIRRDLVEPSGWGRVLRRSLCEDTALTVPLRRSGWRFRFTPALIAVDRDDSLPLRPTLRWIARQLLMARLHHPGWPLVLLHGLGTTVLLLASGAAAVALGLTGVWAAALQLLAALLLYELGCVALLLWIQALVAAAIPLPARIPWGLWLRWLPLGQLVYGLAALRAQLAGSVEWSGVVYRLRGRGVVQATGVRG